LNVFFYYFYKILSNLIEIIEISFSEKKRCFIFIKLRKTCLVELGIGIKALLSKEKAYPFFFTSGTIILNWKY